MKDKNKVFGLISEIDNILSMSFKDLIKFDDVYDDWEIGKKRLINGTENICIEKTKKRIRFITQIPPLFSFDIHNHDVKEVCLVLSGKLKDTLTGKIWSEGQRAVFEPMQLHRPCNPFKETVFLQVDFIRI